MEHLLGNMAKEAVKSKKSLKMLKNLAVRFQQFELSAHLRDIEKENFPESEETTLAKKRAKDLNLLFRMADMNVNERVCWLFDALIKEYDKKEGKFNIEDAFKIVALNKEIFDIEDED